MPPHQNPTCCSNINTNHQPLLSVLSNWLSRLLNYASLKFQRFNILYRLCQGIHDDVNTIRKSRREVSSNIRCHFFWQFSLFNLASSSLVISNRPNWTQLRRSWRKINLGSFLFCSSFVCDQASTWLCWKVMVIQAWTTIFGAWTEQINGTNGLTLTLGGEGGIHH